MKKNRLIIPALLAFLSMQGYAQELNDSITSGKPAKYSDEMVEIGYHKAQHLEESTSSISTVYNEDFNKRSAKNIANSLFGYGTGLTTLQGSGRYADAEPTFFIRGLQSLSTNNPLILVDGIERDITDITPEEVETVTILKDAAAVAMYGNKGINGVVNITTKRGNYNTREIKFTYDHGFGWQARKPKFVDSYSYANAMNEALANDGLTARYTQDELNAFRSGQYPYLYANVDWLGETYRDMDATNIYNISFRGGASKFRYYAMANLTTNKGFIANPYMNDGYSTQDQYSRANLRTNLDIDLTEKTKLKLNVLGILSETRTPGADADDQGGANLWDMIYTLPSAAFPARLENGTWGGSATWAGTKNPLAVSQAAAYTKFHERTLFADMTLAQDLSSITPGLGASGMLSYDNYAQYWENHSKTFVYGSNSVTAWENGVPSSTTYYTDGKESAMSSDAKCIAFTRVFNFAATLFYDRQIDKDNKIYSQLKWDYEYRNTKGTDQTWYRQNASFYTHYGYKDKYFADLNVVASASNKLAPGHQWSISPIVGLAWVMSKENFMKDLSWINFMKLRASFGVIHTDRLPLDDDSEVTNYWEQTYGGGGYYPFDTNYSVGTQSWSLGRLASLNSTHEKAYKYNFGLDAGMFNGLDVSFDAYYERRSDIWVSSSGHYSSVLGFTAPYENGGIVDSWGVEIGADYRKKIADITLNIGANFALAKNEIIEQMEEPRMYDNLITTGNPLKQTYGMEVIGYFKDQADIENSPKQSFGDVTPGDIKYKDVNGDNIIDANDKVAIGYSTTAPEIYYSFNLGAEWKGLGFDAMFQGAGRYSAVLNTKSLYWPLINNTTISQEYYDNRWTPENQDAKYPRLSSQSNENNYQTNTLWLADRSFLKLRSIELYYKFPQSWVKKSKILSNAKIYVRGIDLLCFDKINIADPEVYEATYPLTRSVVAGLTIGF
ncbi:TonB-dependent receptor SusC [Bacteroidaceae bacterium]|uniref:SusC/RagA family TonB-linked outer membrane protein n=1 Tax=uncultured Phocaeicola sp. TaxID=990718 RepID=UPI0014337050|nr:SusC/RagA family TonB-linked outer membrane protein [uncultured Phocaeicola sp.]GFI01132.1 TonB-dependent receptor SusC [Bacteroidaceae bacterium]